MTSRRGFLTALGQAVVVRRRRPNVLWIMTDEQRPDSLGCYGSAWAKTPAADQLAREGALFEAAYTPSPVCVPARSCLLSGRYGSSVGVLHNRQRLPRGTAFLTWAFQEAGYRTASFGKKHYFVEGRQAFQVERGRATDEVVDATRYLKDYRPEDWDAVIYPGPQPWVLAGRFPEGIEQTAEARNVSLALQWLDSLERDEAFFMRVSLNAPHTPVVAPKPFAGSLDPAAVAPLPPPDEDEKPRYEREAWRNYQGSHRLSAEQLTRARRYYYERVSFVDHEIGRLIDTMRRRGRLDNTIIALVSDHGTHLGDHGLLQKQTFYEQVVTVPYIFHYPRAVSPGRRFRTPVTTLSLLPTLLELAGLSVPRAAQAGSLASGLRNGVEPASGPVFSEIKLGYRGYRDDDRLVMIRKGRHKLFLFEDPRDPQRFAGREEGSLYDLAEDPGERRNRFSAAASRSIIEELRRDIAARDRDVIA